MRHLLVVAPHPDDETVGVGCLIADAARHGWEITVLVLTDGEASHPGSPTITAEQMASRRRAEVQRAVRQLAPTAQVVHAGLPDGALSAHELRIESLIQHLCSPGTLMVAPWPHDGHPDHEAAGRAAAAVARRTAHPLGHYLVWAWHWSEPADLPWDDVVLLDASLEAIRCQEAALAEFYSQSHRFSAAPEDRPLLTEAVLAPFRRGFTTLIADDSWPDCDVATPSTRARTFDDLLSRDPDPWDGQGWYERRKRALTMAALRQPRYERGLDVGCSTGALTADLADRVDDLDAVDVSSVALQIARRRVPPEVRLVHGDAPEALEDLPGPYAVVVLSEIGYFLRPSELWLTLGALLRRLEPGGELLMVHWRHPTTAIPLDGPAVHRVARASLGPGLVQSIGDPDMMIDTFVVAG